MTSFRRRKNYHLRCQDIIDDIHNRVDRGERIEEDKCIDLYGRADYYALRHEIRMLNSQLNTHTMTDAMEWLYYSQHFKYQSRVETRATRAATLSVISIVVSCITALYTLFS